MKNKLANYLVFILFLFLSGNSFFLVTAQTTENLLTETKEFGYSLKKYEPKKKEKGKSKKKEIYQLIPPLKSSQITNDDETILVETNLILNEVLVFDKDGQPVKGLKKGDFIIKEDGELQDISTFISGDSEEIPRSIILIIDYSSSQLPFIETSIDAAKVLIDKLNPNDRIAIVTDDVKLLQGFTNDKNLLKEKLESLKINALSGKVGLSRQYSALMATLNELFDEKSLRPIIIFQTDGDQLSDLKREANEDNSVNPQTLGFNFKNILTALERNRATIYTIIPGLCLNQISGKEKLEKAREYIEKSERIWAKNLNFQLKPGKLKLDPGFIQSRIEWLEKFEDAITTLAKFTGGSTKCLEQTGQADKVYSEVLKEMNQRYVIGYYPKNQARDGKSRNVETEVRGHSEYKILGRKNYILSQ